jgi:hypothetical protein
MKRRVATVGLVVLALLGLVYGRVLFESRREWSEGRQWLAKDDPDEAIVHYRRAALWYAPVNPWCVAALDGLSGIAKRAERRGEIDRALAAWRAIRGGVLGTRSFYTPTPGRLRAANRHIAALMAKQPRPAQDVSKTEAALAREHLALLERNDAPSVFWSVVLLAGFFGWIGAAFAFIYRGLDAEGRLVRPLAARWASAVLVGIAVWVLGMVMA